MAASRFVVGLLLVVAGTVAVVVDAKTTKRSLEDYVPEYKYDDLSQFSLHFDKCQAIQMYDDEIAQDGDSSEPFAWRNFVAFRICPTDSCHDCFENFGRYVVDVETYLAYTVQNRQQAFEQMCKNCENGQCNDGQENCNACNSICTEYNQMEENGYVDASQFVECQRLNIQRNDDDDDAANAEQQDGDNNNGQEEEVEYFIGPRCGDSSDGKSRVITIGLFADENCYEPLDNVNMEEIMGYKLSYLLLSHSLDFSNKCLSCSEDDFNNNANDRQDGDNVNEMCEEIYDAAAKCETPTGIQWGFMRENAEEGQFQNQAASEFYACNFIQSIYWDSYDNKGVVNYKAKQDVYLREVTQNQQIAMGALLVVICGMVLAVRYFNDKIASITGEDGIKAGTFV